MSERTVQIKKAIPIIIVTWILSLVTTLAVVYVAPNIFPPLTTEKIADSAIITSKLGDGTVTSAKILDGTITAVDIADGSLITVKVANDSITTTKIADGSVSSAKIADNAVVTIKMADGAVTSAKILDGTITATDLATGSVTRIKIADGAITTSKIADEAVTQVKLASQAIPFISINRSDIISTTETAQFVDMSGMSIVLNLNRTSHLLILFSVEALPDWDQRIYVRALVNEDVAYPGEIFLTPIVYGSDGNSYFLGFSIYTCHFYLPSISAGTYTVKIQWLVSGGIGDVAYRCLTAIALPA